MFGLTDLGLILGQKLASRRPTRFKILLAKGWSSIPMEGVDLGDGGGGRSGDDKAGR